MAFCHCQHFLSSLPSKLSIENQSMFPHSTSHDLPNCPSAAQCDFSHISLLWQICPSQGPISFPFSLSWSVRSRLLVRLSLSLLSVLHFSKIMLLFRCEDGSSTFSETSINIYHIEWRHSLQDSTLLISSFLLISSLSIKLISTVKMNFFPIIYRRFWKCGTVQFFVNDYNK
jgi:hypothetical protein